MKRSQTAFVLTKIAAVDNRRLDDPNAQGTPILDAWHELIGDLNYQDCLEAVNLHRKQSTEWLQPAHIVALVKEIRETRCRGIDFEDLNADVDPTDIRAWLAVGRYRMRAIADGASKDQALALPIPPEYTHATLTPQKRLAALEAAQR